MTSLLTARDLRRSRGTHPKRWVLDGANLVIDAGELVALEGASGSGKTSLLRILGGLDSQWTGEMAFGDTRVEPTVERSLLRVRRDFTATAFQHHALLPHLTLRENLLLPAVFVGRLRSSLAASVDALLETYGLSSHAHALPGTLSGGQAQRAALIRALAVAPPLLLADEPTGNLDDALAAQVGRDLRAHVRGTGRATLVVSHDPRLLSLADRRLRLHDGVLAEVH